MTPQTWLVTGCSSGLGLDFINSLIRRGDTAIATTRGPTSRLQTLKDIGAHVYSLDVTAPVEEIKATVNAIVKEVGHIDVLVNNAGYVHGGLMEETSTQEWHTQFNTNLYGTIKVTQAVLPHMRERRKGSIVLVGSVVGWVGWSPSGVYNASKFAIEAFNETLTAEIASFGLKSIVFEPGMFRTEVFDAKHFQWTNSATIPELDQLRKAGKDLIQELHKNQAGDPKKAVEVMIDVVKSEGMAEGKTMPTRLPLGRDALDVIRTKCEDTLKLLNEWESVIVSTNIDES
ncbi:hypothetical protein B0J11DRAFT_178481 [Dendryphion nanum]|uniref:Uncharacterized protein n=1 Tax=Dendryphion nanum TaxID=256645 RepID=A0A9P9EFD4_9PLEO|nr:hypothetical protein B0J11DRAFT_178481 [Dendryphion nanum]